MMKYQFYVLILKPFLGLKERRKCFLRILIYQNARFEFFDIKYLKSRKDTFKKGILGKRFSGCRQLCSEQDMK